MHILVTNDDGVHAPGLLALVQSLKELGQVTVLAPDKNWSASGHVKTLHRPLRVRETTLADGTPARMCDGAPSDCVALALLGLVTEKVDLVVSGINPTANLGQDMTYSGTVMAAMEGLIGGIPALAVSLNTPDDHLGPIDFSASAQVAQRLAKKIWDAPLVPKVLLNVNVPYGPEETLHGYQVTRQGQRIYRDQLVQREDPRGRPYYWIGGEAPTGYMDDGTDFGAMNQGAVSITPLHLDMTAYASLDVLRRWQF